MTEEQGSATPAQSQAPVKSSGGNKNVIIIVVVILAVLLVIGYIAQSFFARKIGENAAEKILEASTGGKVDIDTKDDGSVSVKTEDGNFSTGSKTEWPSDLPSDVPKFSYGTLTYASNSADVWSIGAKDVKSSDSDKYVSSITGSGWTSSGDFSMSGTTITNYEKGSWLLTYTYESGNSNAQITVSKKLQ
ncbi:MAG TPA: hypothetical protein PK263_03290 [bacterium]|nr:hypothetical protein [bacterium]